MGSHHARFCNFVTRPALALDYLKGFFGSRNAVAQRDYPGHNPAGALMVVVLLAGLLSACLTGMLLLAGEGEGRLPLITWPTAGCSVKAGWNLPMTSLLMV